MISFQHILTDHMGKYRKKEYIKLKNALLWAGFHLMVLCNIVWISILKSLTVPKIMFEEGGTIEQTKKILFIYLFFLPVIVPLCSRNTWETKTSKQTKNNKTKYRAAGKSSKFHSQIQNITFDMSIYLLSIVTEFLPRKKQRNVNYILLCYTVYRK